VVVLLFRRGVVGELKAWLLARRTRAAQGQMPPASGPANARP
jgi:hypothetical protein